MSVREIFDNDNREIYRVRTHAAGPQGELPLTPDMLDQPTQWRYFWYDDECRDGLVARRA
jgi:hypothetical protein